jgi:competence protein ComEC
MAQSVSMCWTVSRRLKEISMARRSGALALASIRQLSRFDLRGALSRAIEEERAHGRDLLLLAPALGLGAALHLGSAANPPASIVWGALAVCAAAAMVFRRHSAGILWLLALSVCLGGAAADVAVRRLDGPRLTAEIGTRALEGRLIRIEDREGQTDRATIAVISIAGLEKARMPQRVVITGHGFAAFRVGDGIAMNASLGPNPQPTHPGAYDPAFVRYFDGVGATGRLSGTPRHIALPPLTGLEGLQLSLERLRMDWTRRIREAIPGQAGPVAASLVTGDRAGISQETNQFYNASGLLHVLSISGLHIALVTGAMFFFVRASLAAIPGLALRWPIKKLAAFAALLVALGYLAISGMAVAAVRATVMCAIALIAIMIDRRAFTLHNVMIAGVIIILIGPDQIASPSFQMSFAATAAIIAGLERGWFPNFLSQEASLPERILRFFGTVVAANLVMSVLAEVAILPIALHHFHRIAWYGSLGNLLSFLLVDFFIMPAVLATLVAFPFGLEGWVLPILGLGVEQLNATARWVGSLDRAITFTPGFGKAAMVGAACALTIAVIARTWLALLAVPIYLGAVLWGAHEPTPVFRADAGLTTFAVQGADGRIATINAERNRFVVGRWLEADGDGRSSRSQGLALQTCDQLGCVSSLRGGRILALTRRSEALEEDCARADILIATYPLRAACERPRLIIDRDQLSRAGGLAIYDDPSGPRVDTLANRCKDRPWCPVIATRFERSAAQADNEPLASPQQGSQTTRREPARAPRQPREPPSNTP